MGTSRFTKVLSKITTFLLGHGESPSEGYPPPQIPPSEPGAQDSKSAAMTAVDKDTIPEQRIEGQISNTSGNYNPSTPSNNNMVNTAKSEKDSESKAEDIGKQDNEEILLQNKRKYICAACENDPAMRDTIQSDKVVNCYVCDAIAEIQRLSKIEKKNAKDVIVFRKTLNDKNKEIESLHNTLKMKEEEVNKLKERVREQTNELGLLDRKYEKAKAGFERNETEIKKLQQTETAMRRQGDVLLDEQAKTLILDILQTKVQAISHIYFKRIRWTNLLKAIREQNLIDILGAAFSPAWHPNAWPLIRDHPNISTQTLVKALLSCRISNLYFQDPFFCCGGAGNILDDIYNRAIPISPETAIIWRAKTFTLLNKMSYDKDMAKRSEIVAKRMFDSLKRLIQADRNLEDHELIDIHKKIVDLVQSSMNLAADWHSREFHFEVINYKWLCYKKFQVYSEKIAGYVTPFPAAKKLEGGKRYDILAVISPGFIRYLKENGEMNYREIVWEKASVLLSEQPL